MDLLVDLPRAALADILNFWLGSYEVALVDSAYCNRRCRPLILQAFAVSYSVQTVDSYERDMIEWMVKRKIKCVNLTYESNDMMFKSSMETLLSLTGPAIQSITFQHEEPDDDDHGREFAQEPLFVLPGHATNLLAKYCHRLRTLNCRNAYLPLEVTDMVNQCRFLKELDFNGCNGISASTVNFCLALSHIESIDISNCRFTYREDGVEGLTVRTCLSVRKLLALQTNLSEVEALILLQSCPNLTELSISAHKGNINAAEVAQYCPLLEVSTIVNPAFVDITVATTVCGFWMKMKRLVLKRSAHAPVCSEEALLLLIQQCPMLQSLSVFKSEVKRQLFINANETLPDSCKQSKIVNLQIGSISAASLQLILSQCPYLHFLHILYYPRTQEQVQNNTLMAEDSLHLLHNSSVKALMLEYTRQLTPQRLANIGNLEEIYLQCVTGSISTNDIVEMVQRCPDLNTFVLVLPPENVNWRVIRQVLDSCSKLCRIVYSDMNGGGKDAAGMSALGDMIRHFYPHVRDFLLDF